jgi:glycerol-3-phosphate dehydrogenase (NAD(P)+)
MTDLKTTGKKVVIIGGGRWARALGHAIRPERGSGVLALHLFRPGAEEAKSDGNLVVTQDRAILRAAEVLLLAVPATGVRQVLQKLGGDLHGGQVLLHAVGSLEPNASALTPVSEVVLQETPIRRIGALAGPALPQDLEEGRPAALLCGSRYDDVGQVAVEVLSARSLRAYTTRDIIGVELARAMVAAVALAGGVADALGLGPGTRAILITRGAAEMARLGVALGASERTFFGLAGVGELIVATEGRGSADFELGVHLGRGLSLKEAQAKVTRRLDGPTMVHEALRLAAAHRVRMTLMTALSRWLGGEYSLEQALQNLFTGPDHAE